jgi:hypothetical protein
MPVFSKITFYKNQTTKITSINAKEWQECDDDWQKSKVKSD